MPYVYFIGIALLMLTCVIHAGRNGNLMPWIYVIVFLPLIGSIAYIVVHIAPDILGSPDAQRIKEAALDLRDPERNVRKLKHEAELSNSVDARQRRGQMEPEFTGRIAQFYPEFNFAILNKGNSGGVYTNAMLDVKRGKDVVAKLKVRSVEQTAAIADVVPGSVSADDGLRAQSRIRKGGAGARSAGCAQEIAVRRKRP